MLVHEHPETSEAVDHQLAFRRGLALLLLAERPGGGVPWVGEHPLTGVALPGVQLVELRDREEDLTTDLHQARVTGAGEPVRDRAHRPDVAGDVLAHHAVTTGRRRHQSSVLVPQVDRQPVDLQLGQEPHPLGTGVPLDLERPVGEFLGAEHVVQAQHALGVLDRRELRRLRLPADRLRRAVLGEELREPLLDRVQPVHHRVVLGVGHGRAVVLVVGVAQFTQSGTQPVDLPSGLRGVEARGVDGLEGRVGVAHVSVLPCATDPGRSTGSGHRPRATRSGPDGVRP
jgi:hypothetical protein